MCKFRNFEKYEVYDDGRIWSYKRNKWLKPQTKKDGYQQIRLYDNEGKPKTYFLHRVIFEAVTGEHIPENLEINHIDENKDNNARSNLELVSPKENCNWGTRIERCSKAHSKQVGAFDKNGELVMTFPSTMEAGRQLCFNQGHISACCRKCYLREGNNVYKGFVWKYI